MLDDSEVRVLRDLAEVHMNHLQMKISDIPVETFFGLGSDPDEIERFVLEQIAYFRDDEAKDPDFTEPMEELLSGFAKTAEMNLDVLQRIIIYELDLFVVNCSQYSGPDDYWGQTSDPTWDIRFDEGLFAEFVEEIRRHLTSKSGNFIVLRVPVRGFQFDSSFELDDKLRYRQRANSISWQNPIHENKADLESVGTGTLRALSSAIKLVYGFEFKLGRIHENSFGAERGHTELREIDSTWSTPKARPLDPKPLVALWPVYHKRARMATTWMDDLLSRSSRLEPSLHVENHLVDLITCFEILFSDGVEIRFKLASRVAAFLTLIGVSGSYPTIMEAYKLRSELVHGLTTLSHEDLGSINRIIPQINRYLRLSILGRVFFEETKQSFLNRVDSIIRNLLDPGSLSEDEQRSLSDLKDSVKPIAKWCSTYGESK